MTSARRDDDEGGTFSSRLDRGHDVVTSNGARTEVTAGLGNLHVAKFIRTNGDVPKRVNDQRPRRTR